MKGTKATIHIQPNGMRTDFCRRAKVELKREPYLSSLKYGRVVTEEDDSQTDPEEDLWQTYLDELAEGLVYAEPVAPALPPEHL